MSPAVLAGRIAVRLVLGAALAAIGPAGAGASPATKAAGPEIPLPPVRDVTLPNGARLLLAERHDVPMISFMAYLRGGSVTDPPGREGVAALTGEMLRKGAGRWNARQLADAVDGVGAAFGVGSGMEVFYASGEFLARDQKLMLDLLRAVLREPTFPDSEFTKLRAQTVDGLKASKEDPGNVFRLYGNAYLFGGHPYGRPVGGDEETVAALTRDDVLRCYREQFGADRLILAVVGDFSAAAMERTLRAAFGDWGRAPAALPSVPEVPRVAGRRVLLVDKPDATQTYFVLANRGVEKTDPDRDVLAVANTAFGGRFTSMLNASLRTESGLTYGASCRLTPYSKGGSLSIGSYAKTESAGKAIDLALDILKRFRGKGISADMLSSSRNYINGQFPYELETSSQLAARLAADSFYGLGREEISGYPARIAAVDSAAVARVVARVYPDDQDLSIVMVGNAAALRDLARRYGKVREIPLSAPMIAALRALEGGAGGGSGAGSGSKAAR
ncbi:MAG TPA: pitrilysin family protein [Acidobacteriota bacterium]|nr:pitrilysin family protein [Acidobacteriota bacterium]